MAWFDKKLIFAIIYHLHSHCRLIMTIRTQIDAVWIRDFTNVKNYPDKYWFSSEYPSSFSYTFTVLQNNLHVVYKAFKQEGLEMRLSKFKDNEWIEITVEEVGLDTEIDFYGVEIIDLHNADISFKRFNDLLEEWVIDDVT